MQLLDLSKSNLERLSVKNIYQREIDFTTETILLRVLMIGTWGDLLKLADDGTHMDEHAYKILQD
jgi:hypothetical protein